MARKYKKYKDYTEEERKRYIRLGERPFTDSKTTTKNIRSKDTLKGTTGTTVNTGAKKETRTSNRNYKRPRYGGDTDLPPKFSRITFPPNPANKKKDEKKKDKSNIGKPAVVGATLLAANKLKSKPAPKVLAKPRPVTKTTVKPKPPVVKPKTKATTKPKIGTKPPVKKPTGLRLTPAEKRAVNIKLKQKKIVKPKIGTPKPPPAPKSSLAVKKPPVTPKAKPVATYGKKPVTTAKPKPKVNVTKDLSGKKQAVTQNQKQQIKKIAEDGKKKGMSKTQIRQAIKKAVPNAAKLAVKVGSRFIPVVGWGLLAYDAYRIGKALKGDKLTKGKDDVFGDGVGFKYGGKIPKTMRKGGKVSHYKHGQSIKRGLIKDAPSGQDLVNSIYDTI